MAFTPTEFLEKARLTLFYEPAGRTEDGRPLIHLHPQVKVVPFDSARGYAHETEYYMPFKELTAFLTLTQDPFPVVLEPCPVGGFPTNQLKGNGLTNGTQEIHRFTRFENK